MELLTLLAALPFAGDADRLGDRDYRTRADAHQRLERAGWLAYPAVIAGGRNAEAADRCDRLLERLWAPTTSAAWLVAMDRDDRPDGELLALRAGICREAVRWKVGGIKRYTDDAGSSVGYWIDPRWTPEELERWLARPGYLSGNEAGEVRLLLEATRRERRASASPE